MGEYGLKIKNIVVGSLLEKNAGVRDQVDMKDAMLCNSLFLDYMRKHGLKSYKNKEVSTRDIIVLDFKYGTRSYEQEKAHLAQTLKKIDKDDKLTEEEKQQKKEYIQSLQVRAEENQDKYVRYNRAEARDKVYTEGVDVYYPPSRKGGKGETIHYKRLFRTPGKAKKGTVDFIREELYDVAKEYLYMGIDLNDYENPLLVEAEAYSSLATSTIIGKIKINPYDILILDDYDSFTHETIISVEKGEDGHVCAVRRENAKVGNSMFDGQGLIDHTYVHERFPKTNGFVLLRNHFCKMACFDTDIQGFFRDYAAEHGIDYETWKLTDIFGHEHYAKDVKVICHESAMKWCKFVDDKVNYDYWCKRVIEDNDSYFGIVKTAKKSKLGNVQKMSYQHVNCMTEEIMGDVIQCTKDYIRELKTNDSAFLEYLRRGQNFSNDYEVLLALVEHNPQFIKSRYFRDRRKLIVNTYAKMARTGRIINEGDNMVIVGSPYAELLFAVGEDPESDPTFVQEESSIQCYSERFQDGEYLAEFRSPFNSQNSLGYLHNHLDWRIKKYFYLGENCIAVNMRQNDFQDANNGSDQDSDTILTLNRLSIVEHAKYCRTAFPTVKNNLPKDTTRYKNTPLDLSYIDNKLMSSQMGIGLSSNLAQIALSYSYSFPDQKYKDYVCILAVLAQVYIDSSKRAYDIDLNEETDRIRRDLNIKVNGYPVFLKPIQKYNNKRLGMGGGQIKEGKYNETLTCPMNYLYKADINPTMTYEADIPMDQFFIKYDIDLPIHRSKKIEKLIEKYSFRLSRFQQNMTDDSDEDILLLRNDFDELINDIKQISLTKKYQGLMSFLIDRAFYITPPLKRKKAYVTSKMNNNRALLLKVLYTVSPEQFLSCFVSNN